MPEKRNILFQWLFWHFLEVPREILKAWKNFLLFNLNYFSIVLLLKTFFSHWRRYKWTNQERGFNIGRFFECFFSNLISRILGAVIRTVLIFIGLLVEVFIIFAGAVMFIGWLILPALLICGLIFWF